MKRIIKEEKCCGCHACFNVCPQHAIKMEEDKAGFKYPIIDLDKCINCGVCKKVCPSLNGNEEKKKIEAYACYNKNMEERINSSSGGIFILLAKEIIRRNGVVFGAAFDGEFNIVHTYVDKEDDLKKFMGSKYTQSTIGNTYKKVQDFLNEDRYVLFSGTPCQIEGLKKYLRKDYDKLYTQDVICHGVPSPKVWKKYLEYQKNRYGQCIKNISFRNKDYSWNLYRMKIIFDTTEYSESVNDDKFLRLFLRNNCLRESCYHCDFKKLYRNSDITLADYWGVENIHDNMNDNKGTSLVIVNSDNGKEIFDCIKDKLVYLNTNLDLALKYNPSMTHSVDISVERNRLIKDIDRLDFDAFQRKYLKNKNLIIRIFDKAVRKIYSIKNRRWM